MQYGHHHGSHAYGINLEEQNKTINKMNTYIEEMRVGQKTTVAISERNLSMQQIFTRNVYIH